MKILRILIGIFLCMIGAIGAGCGLLSILDPIGAQMADDGNPFGKLFSPSENVFITSVYAIVLLLGIIILIVPRLKDK